jgi:hypothetical protein
MKNSSSRAFIWIYASTDLWLLATAGLVTQT